MSFGDRIIPIIAAAATVLTLTSSGARASVFACDFSGNLFQVNTATAALTFIGSTGIFELGGLEFAADGTLYGMSTTVSTASSLYTIDPLTGTSNLVGSFGVDYYEGGIAFSPGGVAYAVNASRGVSGPSYLSTVDLLTGTATVGAEIGTEYHDVNGVIWRSDDNLVGLVDETSTTVLAAIDPTTGAYSTIANMNFKSGLAGGLTTDFSTGTNYLATSRSDFGSNSLYTFDAFTGSTTLVGEFSGGMGDFIGITGLASNSESSAVPEPTTLALFGLGLVGLRSVRRRKTRS